MINKLIVLFFIQVVFSQNCLEDWLYKKNNILDKKIYNLRCVVKQNKLINDFNLVIDKNNRFRIEYLDKIIISDNEKIYNYSKNTNQLFIEKADEKEIIELANQLASEHLSIASEKKVHLADKINSAGSIFLGEISSEVLADYVAGPSHVMPTNGSARYSSSLSSRTFQKTIPVLAIDKDRFIEICNDAEKLAKLESLQAHSEAISVRKKNYFME